MLQPTRRKPRLKAGYAGWRRAVGTRASRRSMLLLRSPHQGRSGNLGAPSRACLGTPHFVAQRLGCEAGAGTRCRRPYRRSAPSSPPRSTTPGSAGAWSTSGRPHASSSTPTASSSACSASPACARPSPNHHRARIDPKSKSRPGMPWRSPAYGGEASVMSALCRGHPVGAELIDVCWMTLTQTIWARSLAVQAESALPAPVLCDRPPLSGPR